MTPTECAHYLGVPNLIMVRYNGQPAPPFDQEMIALQSLREVVWSIVGAGGETFKGETQQVCDLASRFGNLSGAMMDDFFRPPDFDGPPALFAPDEVRAIQEQLRGNVSPLDLWVVLYDFQLHLPFEEYLRHCDVITFWTWKARDLPNLESSFQKLGSQLPDTRKLLGIYLYDYGDARPMPLRAVQSQCEMGLRWLRERRIEGLIFLASCIGDLGFETVEWTRQWIASVGDQPL